MHRVRLGIDIDDTTVDYTRPFLVWHNQTHGTMLHYDDIVKPRIEEVIGCTSVEFERRINLFAETETFSQLPAYADALEVLPLLAKQYELHSITARPPSIKDKTHALLDFRFPGIFGRRVHMTGELSSSKEENGYTKGGVCGENGIRYMVDDAITHAVECSDRGIVTFLIRRPWNGNGSLEKERVFVVDNWHQIHAELANFTS
ncbi:hypothetical protein HYZ97_02305 [Candidatus Pacearchaeota archaeon]|nr:hypothetical protein [Candidatus Pacearchaeota archaeon]